LIHEPTAACMTAVRERRLAGRVAVVDLGAGTLDVSLVEVDEGVYDVQQVLGDNEYGGQDFNTVLIGVLAERLAGQGVAVPASGRARGRLAVGAEYLKVTLPSQEQCETALLSRVGDRHLQLGLSGARLAGILAEPL